MKLLFFNSQFFLIISDLHTQLDIPYQSNNLLQISYDNILISKLFFSKIQSMKRESISHPTQNFIEIYNPDMSDNVWNIYDIMNRFPYVVVIAFCSFYINILKFYHIKHIVLGKLNLIYS